MILERAVLENFLTLAGPVDFRFTDEEPLWVLSGPNGAGKSAVFDATRTRPWLARSLMSSSSRPGDVLRAPVAGDQRTRGFAARP